MKVWKPAPPVTSIGALATGRPSGARRIPSMAPVVNCASRIPGIKATVAIGSPSRRTTGRLRLLLEHGEAADRIPKGATHNDVRQVRKLPRDEAQNWNTRVQSQGHHCPVAV